MRHPKLTILHIADFTACAIKAQGIDSGKGCCGSGSGKSDCSIQGLCLNQVELFFVNLRFTLRLCRVRSTYIRVVMPSSDV